MPGNAVDSRTLLVIVVRSHQNQADPIIIPSITTSPSTSHNVICMMPLTIDNAVKRSTTSSMASVYHLFFTSICDQIKMGDPTTPIFDFTLVTVKIVDVTQARHFHTKFAVSQ